MQDVGRVTALYRYPVKSMRGEAWPSLSLTWTGFDGDRQYAFTHTGDTSRFPWLTGRNVSELVLYLARYENPSDTRQSAVTVTAPDGTSYDIRAPELAARLSAAGKADVYLLQVNRGTYDYGTTSVVTQGTLDALAKGWGGPLDLKRFRQNIVVDSGERETDWLGGTLIFGDDEAVAPRLHIDMGIARCAMVTIDPTTAKRDPKVLRLVAQDFANEIGAYAAVQKIGVIKVGDRVRLAR